MSQLEPCPHCHRHVRVSEASCPFCAGSLAFEHLVPRTLPASKLGRAATFAFAAIAMSQSACTEHGHSPPTDAGRDGGVTPGDVVTDQALPPDDDGGVAIYAAAPTKDAGQLPPNRG